MLQKELLQKKLESTKGEFFMAAVIRAVWPETKLAVIPKDATKLHLIRPVKKELLLAIIKKCSNLQAITLSKSCLQRMPKSNRALLQANGIELAIETRKGRPISVPLQKMLHALEMRKDYRSLREIERVTGIAKSTVHYLERYAQRAKVKNGGKVIYLR